jgi:tetratricopeptide (TPR) repeat protein
MWLFGTGAEAQETAVQHAGTEVREAQNVTITEHVHRRLTQIHELMGEGDVAEGLKRLGGLESGRLSAYESALVQQTYGFVYAQQGKYPQAIEAFEACIALDVLPNAAQQGMLYSLAGLYAAQSRFEATVRIMMTWFKFAQEPVAANAYMLVGSSYSELEEYAKALPYVMEAIKRSEKPNESWYLLALSIRFDRKEFTEAVKLLRSMVVYWPGKAINWEMLSSAYMELKQDSNALATLMLSYQRGLVEGEDKLLNLAKMNMFLEIPFEGGKILETGMKAGSIEKTQKNLELLLSAWTGAREFDKAIGVIDVLAPMVESGTYFWQRAQLFNEKANWPEVISSATLALERGGLKRPGEAYVLMGMAHSELGEYDRAVAAFEQAKRHGEDARRNATAWIDYVNDRRQVAVARN